jgi:hypothetical protein
MVAIHLRSCAPRALSAAEVRAELGGTLAQVEAALQDLVESGHLQRRGFLREPSYVWPFPR